MEFSMRALGNTGIQVTPIGLGVWQFAGGRGAVGSYWPTLEDQVMNEIVQVSLEGGINWFDTAEVYGWGRSEQALAHALNSAGRTNGQVVIATKWWPAFRLSGTIRKTIDQRLQCLAGYDIDLYQVHQPWSFSSVESEMDAMTDLVRDGKIKAIGVSNFGPNAMGRAYKHLERLGIPLASNQVKYNLVDRRIEFNGVFETAKALGMTIIAYSPLEQGLLTGKFHKQPELLKHRSGLRKMMGSFRRGGLPFYQPVIDVLERMGRKYAVSPAQIALNWLITFRGEPVVAIPGATRVEQARDNVGALNFRLDEADTKELDLLTRDFWY
ncbi:aldo/keto reductase [bacterium]|nr:aldo/keto reductase [bacterium]